MLVLTSQASEGASPSVAMGQAGPESGSRLRGAKLRSISSSDEPSGVEIGKKDGLSTALSGQ
jgi:hypothetical protein